MSTECKFGDAEISSLQFCSAFRIGNVKTILVKYVCVKDLAKIVSKCSRADSRFEILSRLSARENFIEFCSRESFKTNIVSKFAQLSEQNPLYVIIFPTVFN
jgi:hypothetical protein